MGWSGSLSFLCNDVILSVLCVHLQVRFDYMVGWRRNSGEGGDCDEQDVTSQKVITGSSQWGCVKGCNSQESLKYRCIGYNKPSNWMVGSGTFEMNVTTVETNIVE